MLLKKRELDSIIVFEIGDELHCSHLDVVGRREFIFAIVSYGTINMPRDRVQRQLKTKTRANVWNLFFG